jgi:hypothetical protein
MREHHRAFANSQRRRVLHHHLMAPCRFRRNGPFILAFAPMMLPASHQVNREPSIDLMACAAAHAHARRAACWKKCE